MALKKIITATSVVAMAVLITGCTGSGNNDLDIFVAETMAKPSGQIETVPAFKPYKPYKYSSLALRSPFDPPQLATTPEVGYGKIVAAPDETRPRQPLESISFASLTMVGIMERAGVVKALIDDGRGQVHSVELGDYLGKNHGKIATISRSQVDIIEIVPDGKNGWVERPRTLALKEN